MKIQSYLIDTYLELKYYEIYYNCDIGSILTILHDKILQIESYDYNLIEDWLKI
jgi:hypothetical protein